VPCDVAGLAVGAGERHGSGGLASTPVRDRLLSATWTERALERPIRPARAGERRRRPGPVRDDPDQTRTGATVSSGSRGWAAPPARRPAHEERERARRAGCVDSSRPCRNASTHPPPAPAGVSTHDGHAGTSRHTRPKVARGGARARPTASAEPARSHTASPAAVQTTPRPASTDTRAERAGPAPPAPGPDHPPHETPANHRHRPRPPAAGHARRPPISATTPDDPTTGSADTPAPPAARRPPSPRGPPAPSSRPRR